jgi:WD40 repeat protein
MVDRSSWKVSARVFDLSSGRELYSLPAFDQFTDPDGSTGFAGIQAVAISPDGKTIVSKQAGPRGGVVSLHIHDSAIGRELRKIELPQARSLLMYGLLAFTPDGKAVAVTTEGKVVYLIDLDSGKAIQRLEHNEIHTTALAFSPDGRFMATGSLDAPKNENYLRLWDLTTGKVIRPFISKKVGVGPALAFSPDGKPRHDSAGLGYPADAQRDRISGNGLDRSSQTGERRSVPSRGTISGSAGGGGQVLRRADQAGGG